MAEESDSTISYNTYSHNFGILIPDDSGVTFTHQSGGMSCTQLDLEGIFLPLRRPTKFLGSPDWTPDGPVYLNQLDISEDSLPADVDSLADWVREVGYSLSDFESRDIRSADIPADVDEFRNWVESLDFDSRDISEIDLTSDAIPDRDWESFPAWVQERGHFYDYDEYHYWLNQDEVDWYGRLDLIDEQSQWNYDPSGDMHERFGSYDPTAKWDSLSEIWEEIDDHLPFVYEEYDHWEETRSALADGTPRNEIRTPIPDGYPEYGAAFKWIQINGSKVNDRGKRLAPWADDLEGEYVIMTYDNCD